MTSEPRRSEIGLKRFDVRTTCRTHGVKDFIVAVYGDQSPVDVALCEPVCPECEHLGAPQGTLMGLELHDNPYRDPSYVA